jgi:hypothetical protein
MVVEPEDIESRIPKLGFQSFVPSRVGKAMALSRMK